jgi:hypothetical protein
MNYARHVGDKKLKIKAMPGATVFFSTPDAPPECTPLDQWAFWRVPEDALPRTFHGRLVGEDSDRRCARLRHTVMTCLGCTSGVGSRGF